jgi:hypothetical protein
MYVHVKYFVSSVPAAANSLENFIRSNRFPSLQKTSSASYSEIKGTQTPHHFTREHTTRQAHYSHAHFAQLT